MELRARVEGINYGAPGSGGPISAISGQQSQIPQAGPKVAVAKLSCSLLGTDNATIGTAEIIVPATENLPYFYGQEVKISIEPADAK